MRTCLKIPSLFALALFTSAPIWPSNADEAHFASDADKALEISKAAIGRQLESYQFRDTERRLVDLSDYRGKPLVVNLIYTACTHTCPVIVQTLHDVASDARDALGRDSFNIITVGFDTRNDTPERMRAFAHMQGVGLPIWQFLSTDAATIERFADALGFVYFPSAKGFDHLAQLSVLDAEGRVYRQVYGENFAAPFLVEPLKDLVFGRRGDLASIEGLINRLRLFCTLYDPAAGRYRFDYSIVIGVVIGFIALTSLGIILIRAIVRERCGRDSISTTG